MKKNILYFAVFFIIFLAVPSYSQTFNELVKRYRVAQKLEEYENMILILDTMLIKYPNNQPEITYFNRGNTYRQLKEYNMAILDYTKAIGIKPDYASAFNNRGISYFDMDEYENAIKDYTEVIKLKPDYPLVYFNRANAYSCQFDYDRAVADYTKSIELKPDFSDSYYNRGNKYYGMGKYKEAILDWEKAVKLDPAYELE